MASVSYRSPTELSSGASGRGDSPPSILMTLTFVPKAR